MNVSTLRLPSGDRMPAVGLGFWKIELDRAAGAVEAAVIPKTTRPERLRENLAIFDFELAADEMTAVTQLDRNRRFNDPGVFCEKAFNTFCPIYE